MAKAGRPPSNDPRKFKLTIRMSEAEYDVLKKYNEATGQTITETMLEGFALLLKKKARKA